MMTDEVSEESLLELCVTDKDGELSINPLYVELYNICSKCLLKFNCPVLFGLSMLDGNLHITLICNEDSRYEMTIRYLTIEVQALIKSIPTIKISYEILCSKIIINRFSLDEVTEISEVINALENKKELKKLNKYVLN